MSRLGPWNRKMIVNESSMVLTSSCHLTLKSGIAEDGRIEKVSDTCKSKGVAQMMAEKYSGAEFDSKKNLVVFQRYCHMYRKGELELLCAKVPGLEVLESSYERGNHVVSLRAT
jgi:hypothetical protein